VTNKCGSRFDDLIYRCFFTITINYNCSHIELLPNDGCLLSRCFVTLQLLNTQASNIQSQSHIATDGRSVSKFWCRALSWAHDQLSISVLNLRFCFLRGALSDERTGLSFVYAAGPCQRSLPRVRVPWHSGPYFTVSNLRLPFSSPPTTRRVTVEVFDPASTRLPPSNIESESYVTTDGQSASLSWYKAPIRGVRPDFYCRTEYA
jgi:hypothetical protein